MSSLSTRYSTESSLNTSLFGLQYITHSVLLVGGFLSATCNTEHNITDLLFYYVNVT